MRMNRKAQSVMTYIIFLVAGIVGAVIVNGVVSSSVNPIAVSSEQHTVSSIPGTFYLNHVEDGVVVGSDTVTNGTATLTRNSDYTIDYTTGLVNVTSNSYGTTFYVDYQYYPYEYLNSSTARTVANYLVPLVLLGLLGYAAVVRL